MSAESMGSALASAFELERPTTTVENMAVPYLAGQRRQNRRRAGAGFINC